MGLKLKSRSGSSVPAEGVDDLKHEGPKVQAVGAESAPSAPQISSIINLRSDFDLHVRDGLDYRVLEQKYARLLAVASDEDIVKEVYKDLKFPSTFSNGAVTWSVVAEAGRNVKVEKQSVGMHAVTYEYDGAKLAVVRVRSRS